MLVEPDLGLVPVTLISHLPPPFHRPPSPQQLLLEVHQTLLLGLLMVLQLPLLQLLLLPVHHLRRRKQ